MKKMRILSKCCMVIALALTVANSIARNAGVLPWAIEPNTKKPVALLGYGSVRVGRQYLHQWSDFGGLAEPGDRGDSARTATREFCEESMYVFSSVDRHFASKATVYPLVELASQFLISNERTHYDMFLLPVPYVPAYEFSAKYTELARLGTTWRHWHGVEKSQFAWVPVDELLNSIVQAALRTTDPEGRTLGVTVRSIDGRVLPLYKNFVETLQTPHGQQALSTILMVHP